MFLSFVIFYFFVIIYSITQCLTFFSTADHMFQLTTLLEKKILEGLLKQMAFLAL